MSKEHLFMKCPQICLKITILFKETNPGIQSTQLSNPSKEKDKLGKRQKEELNEIRSSISSIQTNLIDLTKSFNDFVRFYHLQHNLTTNPSTTSATPTQKTWEMKMIDADD